MYGTVKGSGAGIFNATFFGTAEFTRRAVYGIKCESVGTTG